MRAKHFIICSLCQAIPSAFHILTHLTLMAALLGRHCHWWWLTTKSCLMLTIPWTVAHQAPLSVEFSRREYWSAIFSGLPFPSLGYLPLLQGSKQHHWHCRQILYQ